MKNILMKLTMATAATVIVTGQAMAQTPYAFDQFTATAGVITDSNPGGCAAGFTCVNLEANDLGIMQRTLTNTATGVSYMQTVITEANANGPAAALGFSEEAFVFGTGGNASNNIALKSRVAETGMSVISFNNEGAFRDGGDLTNPTSVGTGPQFDINQNIDLGAGDFVQYTQTGENGNNKEAVNMRIDGQRFAVRQALGATYGAQGTGTIGDASFSAGPVNYTAGNGLKVTWIGMDQSNNQAFGFQRYDNITTAATSVKTGNDGQLMGQWVDNGPWAWDTTYFGNAPNPPPAVPEFP